ncbi:MAG: hypothetical protein AAF801_15820 [Pseudomonadota bacterium]
MPIEEIIRQDDLNQFPWQSIVTSVDTDTGEVLGRTITYDDGTKTDQRFENGVLRESFQSDNFDQFGQPLPGGGAKRWESIQTSYDAEGKPEFKTIIFDDGTRTDQRFENGVLRESFQSDNFDEFGQPLPGGGAKPWESIETRFDANGRPEFKTIIFDDGTRTDQRFENGVLRETFKSDNFDQFGQPLPGGGAKPWESIATRYDSEGNIDGRSVVFDNGVHKEQFYIDGILSETLQTDGFDFREMPPADGGAFDWEAKISTFDTDGSLSSRTTVFDDKDVIIFNYENAQIIERLRIDGDGDEEWLLSVTTYADAGPQTVNYETLNDIPNEYLDYFGLTPT